MVKIMRSIKISGMTGKTSMAIASLGFAFLAAGCSSSVSRFDYPSFSLNGDTGETGSLPPASGSGAAPLSSQGPNAALQPRFSPTQGIGGRAQGGQVRSAALPAVYTPRERSNGQATDAVAATPSYSAVRPAGPSNAGAVRPIPVDYSPPSEDYATGSDNEIIVRRGDTLYGLARQYGVTVGALKAANGLSTATLKPGQRLVLPGAQAARPPAAQRRSEPARRFEPPLTQSSNASMPRPSDWQGRYTVVSGDSLYKIASRYGVKSADLQRVNNISDPRRVRPGTVLYVPGSRTEQPKHERIAAASPPDTRNDAPPVGAAGTDGPSNLNLPQVINGTGDNAKASVQSRRVQVVKVEPPKAAASNTASESAKLRWPAKGRILAGFGRRTDGTHNDGLNLALPMGAEIHAAENGVVAYAGSELKGYGNLVLVRHDNGWVTAYAHADKLKVKRGDKVQRGQVIATAGKSGEVAQPQLHFELRQGSKPVDPLPYLAKI